MKKKTLLTSILTIVMCLCLSVGGTFALFTSESKVDVSVSSGKVKVLANVDETSVQTKKLYDADYTQGANNTYEGVATFNEDGLTLEKFIPGDGIKFNIVVKNESNVTVKYRTIISCDIDNGLFSGLNVSISDNQGYNGVTLVSNWELLAVGANDAIVPVTIELPESAGNDYQDKTCTISYKVEAVQGNANVANVDANGITTTQNEVKDVKGNTATIPVGATISNGEKSFTLKVEELEATESNVQTGYFELKEGNNAYAFNVNIPEVDSNNNAAIIVTIEAPKNLENVAFFHKGSVMTPVENADDVSEHHEFYYDKDNGKITFATKNFSNFTLVSGLENVAFVGTADELVNALEGKIAQEIVFKNDIKIDPANMSNAYGTTGINIKNLQTLNGNGFILDVKGAGGTWDSGINITGGTIKNITVTGSFRGIFINHNSEKAGKVYLENVTTDGTVYTISCDQGTGNGLEATNCTFKGWTSFAATIGEVKFTNCVFGKGSGYNYSRPYAPTTYINCSFEEGHVIDPRAEIILYDCELNGVKITKDNLGDLVTNTDKAKVGTVVNNGDELQDAINNGEGNIILGGDIDLGNGGLVFP